MPDDTKDPQAFMTAAKAASMLGLDERLIEWALDRRILAGRRDKSGVWTLSRSEIESGQRPLEEQFAYLSMRQDGEAGSGSAKPGAASADEPDAEQAAGPLRLSAPAVQPDSAEIARLGKRVDDLLAALAAKDALIGELAKSIARMGEMALERLPRSEK